MTLDRSQRSVLHVVASTDRRGAETAAVELSWALQQQGRNSSVVALAPGRDGGLGVSVLGPSRFSLATLHGLRHQIAGAALVIGHGSSTLPAVASCRVGTGVPFVYRSIGDPLAWVTTAGRRGRVRIEVARAAAVVALWRGSAVTWHERLDVPASRLVVIPNAVRATEFSPASPDQRRSARRTFGLAPDRPVALCLGALSREKRIDLAVRAVAALDGVDLLVVGRGPERERLAALASSVAPDRVHLVGAVDSPGQALAAADVVVIPSDTEGQPAVAIEAGLAGLPVVATRVGGLAEVVEDGHTGYLVAPGDGAALGAAVRSAWQSREQLGRAGRQRCLSRFDLDRVVPSWTRLVDSLISR